MEAADFAVSIEEVMAEVCTAYECIFEDEEEIGRIWKFIFEETIDGYIALEDNEETLGIQTVAMGLYLRDITDYSREDLIGLFYANADFVNASFSVVKIPVPIESESIADLDEDSEEEEEPEFEEHDILTIQTRIPGDAFDPDEFKTYIENMLYQYQVTMEAYEGGDEEDEDLDLIDELDELDELDEPEKSDDEA